MAHRARQLALESPRWPTDSASCVLTIPVREFSIDMCEVLALYVYRLVDPRTNRTFYVGKGRDNRVFAHVKLARSGEEGPHYDRIRDIRDRGLEPQIIIHPRGLQEQLAFEIEAALIDAYCNEEIKFKVTAQSAA